MLLVIAILVPLTAVGDEKIVFDENEYFLSWVDVKGNNVTNEYLIKGTTLEKWDTLLAVRLFKGKEIEIKEVLSQYMEQIKPLLAVKPDILKKEGTPVSEDVTLVLFLLSPDKTYYEYNLHRFVRDPSGVKSYQFAQRLPFKEKLDVSKVMTNQAKRIEQLGKLNVSVLEKM
jgi:hypothetical protein